MNYRWLIVAAALISTTAMIAFIEPAWLGIPARAVKRLLRKLHR